MPGRDLPGAVEQRRRLGPDGDQPGQGGPEDPRGEFAGFGVAGGRGVAEFGHVAEDREGAPVLREVPEGLERGPDGLGVRVVRVVDDRHSVRSPVDFHPPPAAGDGGGQPVRDVGEAEAELARERGRGQGIRNVMRAVQPQGDRR